MNDPTFRKPELTVIERARYLTGPERPETNPSYAEWREIVEGLLKLLPPKPQRTIAADIQCGSIIFDTAMVFNGREYPAGSVIQIPVAPA